MTWDGFFHLLPAVIVVFASAALVFNFLTRPRPVWSMMFNTAILVYGLARSYFEYLA